MHSPSRTTTGRCLLAVWRRNSLPCTLLHVSPLPAAGTAFYPASPLPTLASGCLSFPLLCSEAFEDSGFLPSCHCRIAVGMVAFAGCACLSCRLLHVLHNACASLRRSGAYAGAPPPVTAKAKRHHPYLSSSWAGRAGRDGEKRICRHNLHCACLICLRFAESAYPSMAQACCEVCCSLASLLFWCGAGAGRRAKCPHILSLTLF